MQTFLPLPHLEDSLACLDTQRLGKQRSETRHILAMIGDPWAIVGLEERRRVKGKVEPVRYGWDTHSTVKMWQGFIPALREYYNINLEVWESYGYENNMPYAPQPNQEIVLPPWFGDEAFHRSHRANLLRKSETREDHREWYEALGWYKEFDGLEYIDIPYIWPS